MRFEIIGPPRTKKTSNRVIRVRGSIRVIPSEANVDWTRTAVLQLRAQKPRGMGGGLPSFISDVNCCALVYRDANRGDLLGYLQAIADALQEAQVVENDRLIASWDGSRMLVDKANPRVEVTLEPLP